MENKIFVVTNPDNGWNCVRGVFEAESEEQIYEHLNNQTDIGMAMVKETYIVHEQYKGIQKL